MNIGKLTNEQLLDAIVARVALGERTAPQSYPLYAEALRRMGATRPHDISDEQVVRMSGIQFERTSALRNKLARAVMLIREGYSDAQVSSMIPRSCGSDFDRNCAEYLRRLRETLSALPK